MKLAVLALLVHAAAARADGFVVDAGSPRAIGRAGVGTVGDDGGGALLVNPAAMARREATRFQLGGAFAQDSLDWIDDDPTAPLAKGQGGSSALPFAGFQTTVHGVVVGVAAMTSAAVQRALYEPTSTPPNQLGNIFDYRYTGIAGSLRRDTAMFGAARRLGEWIALGVSAGVSRVAITEQRRVWAGFSGVAAVGDPAHDVEVQLDASGWSPSAVVGVLVAPPDTRVELGASVAYAGGARATGNAAATGSTAVSATPSGTAAIDLPRAWTVRTGARYLGDRWIAEVGGDLWLLPASAAAPTWQLAGIGVADTSGATTNLVTVASRASTGTHGAIRAAIDVELVAGFLWATAGYAFTTAGTDSARLSASFGELAGHTAALGLEAIVGGYTITLGWSHTWAVTSAPGATAWTTDNPFGAGDAPVPLGTYRGGTDIVGLALDVEL